MHTVNENAKATVVASKEIGFGNNLNKSELNSTKN